MVVLLEEGLLFNFPGKQTQRTLPRDPSPCVSLFKPVVILPVMFSCEGPLRHASPAQEIWNGMITEAFGEERLNQIQRKLSLEQTSLGVLKPDRYRIYDID